MSFSDLTPENTITGGTDDTPIGNVDDKLKVSVGNGQSNPVPIRFPEIHYDAFGRQRTSQQETLFELSAGEGLDTTRYVSTDTTGTGTVGYDAASVSAKLSVSASGDEAITQTRRRIEYNKGHSQLIYLTGRFAAPTANVRQRRGYFTDTHGLFFEIDGTTAYVTRRSSLSGSVVDTRVAQSNWNRDTLNGSGDENNPSGFEWDPTMQMVTGLDFGWLGSLGIRYYLVIGNVGVLVHVDGVSNILPVPYMDSGMAPLRSEITATGTITGTHSMYTTCGAVKTEGAGVQIGRIRVVDTGVNEVSLSTTEKIVAGIKIQDAKINGSIKALGFNIQPSSGSSVIYYKIVYNPTLTGATWANLPGLAQGLTNNPTSYSGGDVISSGYLDLGTSNGGGGGGGSKRAGAGVVGDLETDVFLGSDIDGNPDALVLVARTISSTGAILFSGAYREFF